MIGCLEIAFSKSSFLIQVFQVFLIKVKETRRSQYRSPKTYQFGFWTTCFFNANGKHLEG